MKKYLMTGVAALAMCAGFTSCSHDVDGMSQEELSEYYAQKIVETYEKAFIENIGQPAPNQDWGFGATTSVAGVRGGTRAVPGITFPNAFSNKTNITEPGTIQKPTINKSGATVISETQTWPNQNIDNAVIYVESGVTLTLPDGSSLQHTKFYLSSGSTLVAKNLYLKGSTDFVNDGGTINIGTENSNANFVLDGLTGTFWNNGSMTIIGDFTESNADGCKIYNGSSGSISANKVFLFKNNLFRNEGVITLTSEFNADQYGHKIYNSGTITTPKIILQKETVLWNEGTITAANSKEIESSSINNDKVQIYNGTNATLKLEIMTLTNNSELVINDGILNVKGKITTQNNSEIVNYNKLTGGEFEMMSGSRFYNVAGGEVTITGLSKISNDGSGSNKDNVWMNSGKYTTGSFEATGGCQNPAAFNNCHMYVTGKFFMNHSNFVLDGGGAVECGSFEWQSDNFFHMGGKALLKVTGQMLMNNQNSSPNYGFWGDDSEYAVIKAGSVEKGSEGKYRAAYYGNLFIDTNDHFGQGRSSADGPWYYFANTVKFSFNDKNNHEEGAKKATDFSITIPADPNGCTPGYNYNPPVTSTGSIRIIAEDLSATDKTDFDFNDIVFDVTFAKDGETTTKVDVQAAGGTLPLRIKIGTGNTEADYQEVHALWEQSPNIMINTNAEKKYPGRGVSGLGSRQLTLQYAVQNAEQARDNIIIEVQKTTGTTQTWVPLNARIGYPAAKICVKPTFTWQDERDPIMNRNGFIDYVTNMGTWDGTWHNE